MKTSESITNISKALVAFGKSMPKVPKDKINPHFKSKYASLSIMIEKSTPILVENKLAIVQQIDGDCMTTTLLHESGEFITATASMPCANPTNPQSMGSAITYARRYAYGAILSLDIDDDDDANAATQTAPPKAVKIDDTKALSVINAATTIEELVKAWTSLTPKEQALPTVTAAKDSLKAKLQAK